MPADVYFAEGRLGTCCGTRRAGWSRSLSVRVDVRSKQSPPATPPRRTCGEVLTIRPDDKNIRTQISESNNQGMELLNSAHWLVPAVFVCPAQSICLILPFRPWLSGPSAGWFAVYVRRLLGTPASPTLVGPFSSRDFSGTTPDRGSDGTCLSLRGKGLVPVGTTRHAKPKRRLSHSRPHPRLSCRQPVRLGAQCSWRLSRRNIWSMIGKAVLSFRYICYIR